MCLPHACVFLGPRNHGASLWMGTTSSSPFNQSPAMGQHTEPAPEFQGAGYELRVRAALLCMPASLTLCPTI